MPRNLKFFYFGYQCPHNAYLLARIKTFAWKERVALELHDVTDDPETCRRNSIFFPTLLVVNDSRRWQGPFTSEIVESLLEDEDFAPPAHEPRQGDELVEGDLVPIDEKSVLSTCVPCISMDDKGLCMGKSEWVRDFLKSTGLKNLGYLHFHGSQCVGGAEFLPSLRVPYPIPDKRDDNAFLACTFRSDDRLDFKSHPLAALIDDLGANGWSTLSTVTSSDGVFPSGPKDWLRKKGFEDMGVLAKERLQGTEIHHMRLRLR